MGQKVQTADRQGMKSMKFDQWQEIFPKVPKMDIISKTPKPQVGLNIYCTVSLSLYSRANVIKQKLNAL